MFSVRINGSQYVNRSNLSCLPDGTRKIPTFCSQRAEMFWQNNLRILRAYKQWDGGTVNMRPGHLNIRGRVCERERKKPPESKPCVCEAPIPGVHSVLMSRVVHWERGVCAWRRMCCWYGGTGVTSANTSYCWALSSVANDKQRLNCPASVCRKLVSFCLFDCVSR